MRKERTYIVIFLILAFLLVSIGYAAITKVLNVTGTASATANQDNFVVKFTGEPTTSGVGTTTATIESDLAAKIDVTGLTTTGEKATATYTITNASEELSADLVASVTTNSNSTYFKVTPTLAKTSLAKGEETTVTVEVELIKTPVGDQQTEIDVEINATAVEP